MFLYPTALSDKEMSFKVFLVAAEEVIGIQPLPTLNLLFPFYSPFFS